ncbi:4Fe-4S cluster-binding domain-containing protein [Candidatus Woesearchaeota archaeon]|nr:4Fe-4S cluster-binding domain-containing protein [Candidatus Woesearchaeota archaeon]
MANTKNATITKTPYHSYRAGHMAKGCQHCVKGEKLVLFVTGLCPRRCPYCPISDRKHQHDVTYANEWPTSKIAEIIEEAELTEAKGAGFTGGDPLVKIHRTCTFIRSLKKRFGKQFHIHLYTSFDLASPKNLKMLHAAGLDEIRFHPDLDDDRLWSRIDNAKAFDWDVGVEIPAIPGKKTATLKLMQFLDGKIKFLNINELEVSDAKANKLSVQGMKTKDSLSYGVKGSQSLALELLRTAYSKKYQYNIHYCTAKLKDKVQLAKRIQRRAKNVKNEFDIINDDGTLTRGAIYFPFLYPSFDYAQKLAKLTSQRKSYLLNRLSIARKHLHKQYGVPLKYLLIDKASYRILTNPGVTQNLAEEIKSMTLKPAIITEYPTWDALIVELDWQ